MLSRMCILVIEDDAGIRGFVRTLLEDEGYRVETAIDGLDGLQQLASLPSLIVLDLQMPVMDGYEFLGRLRTIADHLLTPVLVVTASRAGPTIDGAQGILRKPFEAATLIGRVSDLLATSG